MGLLREISRNGGLGQRPNRNGTQLKGENRMNPYFSLTDSLYDLTERYPMLVEWLAANGFENLSNETMRKTMGKTVSIDMAIRSKHLDAAIFEQRMIERIAQENASDCAEGQGKQARGIRMEGVLPCPIRIQLLEHLESWIEKENISIAYDLPAASMGLDWLKERIADSRDESELADLYLSAGFSLFFDHALMGRYQEAGVFSDLTGAKRLNACFDNEAIDLKDPRHQYAIVGIVPAIFMVNTALLGDRSCPKSWHDLLQPEFENMIALPMQDLDLFNAVLLGLYKEYGEEGIAKLGRNLMRSMHPAQMVKSGKKRPQEETPLITVMPYFFTSMIDPNGVLQPVWPKEGAIVSPIFLLAKASAKDNVQPLVDFLFSKSMGEVFSAQGKFPSTHPDVDNQLTSEQTFLWPGWDFIYTHDIGALLKETEQIFLDAAGEKI